MLVLAHPWILLFFPLPFFVHFFLPPIEVSHLSVRVPFGERLRSLAVRELHSARKIFSVLCSIIVWVLLLTALARPQWLEEPLTRDMPTRDLLLLVDLSASMRQEDFVNSIGMPVDRLSAVKEVLGDFLLRREGDRVALAVFGDAPYLQSPFTTDLDLSRQLLDEASIGMAGPRTAFGDAIGYGISLFEQSEAPAKTIISLTDGNDTASQVPPIEASRVARERGIRIHTVAIGDPTTVGEEELDEETLRDVAQSAGGSYFYAANRSELEGIYTELDHIETRKINTVTHRPRIDLFYWPLLLALLIILSEKVWFIFRHMRAEAPLRKQYTVRVDPLSGKLEVQTP